MPFNLPHIDISGRAVTRVYQAPQEARGGGAAARDRAVHGARLQAELTNAFQRGDLSRPADERLEPPTGTYIEVELRRGQKADLLDRKSDGVASGAAQTGDNDTTRVALFVPDDARAVLEDILRDYTTGALTEKREEPQHKNKIEPIEAIREARLETFWTDDPAALPVGPNDSIWWEVWCFKGSEERLVASAEQLAARVADRDKWLSFPESIVVPILARRITIELLLFAAVGIAELRRASATPWLLLEENREAQLDRARGLAERTVWPARDVPSICIFDTGINRGHVLIEPALGANDLASVKNEWGLDDHAGHGTGMAGIALFGDLTHPLSDEREVILDHRIESVKILPPDGFPPNDPAGYGSITQSATAKGELLEPARTRIFCMAVTNRDVSGARGTTWSAAIDQAAAGVMIGDEDDAPKRLFVVSAGNAPAHIERDRILTPDDYPIEDPAQAWNALTVGGCTDKIDIAEDGYNDWTPLSDVGTLSPFTRTSGIWPHNKAPFKPEIVMEAGNRALSPDEREVLTMESLGLLTTGSDVDTHPVIAFAATSAAAAQAARLAARLSAKFPEFWPETIRALIVHSAEWTPAMRQALRNAPNKRTAYGLVRQFGYGVPDYERAAASASNHLALMAQNTITPFKIEGQRKFRDCHFYKLPWPRAELERFGDRNVQLKITLSYFIEPNPGRSAAIDPSAYQSHGLRFDLRRRLEPINSFVRRVNPLERENPRERVERGPDDEGWLLGSQSVSAGSLHCDVWSGPAAHLAARDVICVKPVMGWWRSRGSREDCIRSSRYALVATLSAPDVEIDLHTQISNIVDNAVDVEIAFR